MIREIVIDISEKPFFALSSKGKWRFTIRDHYDPGEVDKWWWKPYESPKPKLEEYKKKNSRNFFINSTVTDFSHQIINIG
jgi:hypothetical protein